MAIDKSTWNKKIKVSQSTIDTIKKQGMTASLKSASSNKSSEYQEALRRMYGDKRVSAATGASKKMTGQASGYRNPKQAGPMTGQPSGYRNPKQAGPAAGQPSGYRNPNSTVNKVTPAKKANNTKSNLLKGVAGTVAAVGILAAGRGKGAGLAAKLAPGLMKNKIAQAALTGEIKKTAAKTVTKKVAPKAVSQSRMDSLSAAASGKKAAAAGRAVTPEQFSAMSSVAKTVKKAPAKKAAPKKTAAAAPKKTGLSAGKRFDANAPKAKAPKRPTAQ